MIDSFAKFDYIKNPELCWASKRRFYVQGKALYNMFRFRAGNVPYPGIYSIYQYIPIYGVRTYSALRTPEAGFKHEWKENRILLGLKSQVHK